MLKENQKILFKWNSNMKKHFIERGYLFTKMGEEFYVDIADLPKNSNKKIQYICDYCLGEFEKIYNDYNKQRVGIIEKDACKSCKSLKIKESNEIKYGVSSTNSLDSTKKKRESTNIEIYGGKNVMHSDEVKKKLRKTVYEKYGTKTASGNTSVKSKMIKTNNKRYGGNSPSCCKVVRKKQVEKINHNYGVDYPMQNKDILEKARETLTSNGNVPISRKQVYVNTFISGEENYQVDNYSLDIALPEEKIYIECDFGGHWLQVKLGKMTQEEFDEKEKRRWYYLYRKGWKEIRIISRKDKVPTENAMRFILDYSFNHLKTHSWVKFDLDESKVIYNNSDSTLTEDYIEELDTIWLYKQAN
jgi:hypothetical protein